MQDIFDDNIHAHDPTTDFLNFVFTTLGGVLSYGNERIIEPFYKCGMLQWLDALDYQFVDNARFNASRGPANFFALRLRAGFSARDPARPWSALRQDRSWRDPIFATHSLIQLDCRGTLRVRH